MGWHTERRLTPLDSTRRVRRRCRSSSRPREALGAHEVHRLLTNVRHGGGLVFALDGGEEIGDSLGLDLGRPGRFLVDYGGSDLPDAVVVPRSHAARDAARGHQIVWRRPAPGPTTTLATTNDGNQKSFTVGVGFPTGHGTRGGRQLVGALRQRRGARLPARAPTSSWRERFEYVRPSDVASPTHGVRRVPSRIWHARRKLDAPITGYLERDTASGRFLAQALIAGLLLVARAGAASDRAARSRAHRAPLAARACGRARARVRRRRRDAHGDGAAGQRAYGGAPAASIARGARRRRRGVSRQRLRSDSPRCATAVGAVVARALAEPVSPRELAAIGEALRDIERHASRRPPHSLMRISIQEGAAIVAPRARRRRDARRRPGRRDRGRARRLPRARPRADRGRARHGEDAARSHDRRTRWRCDSRASSSRPTSCRPTSPASALYRDPCAASSSNRDRCSPISCSPTKSTARRPRRRPRCSRRWRSDR